MKKILYLMLFVACLLIPGFNDVHAATQSFVLNIVEVKCDFEYPAGPAVRLDWPDISGTYKYNVYRDNVFYNNTMTDSYFYNSINLVAGHSYTYRVEVLDVNGVVIAVSNTVTAEIPTDICGVYPDKTQCSDGIDNDGNGRIDYPNDPGCNSLGDTLEQYIIPIKAGTINPSQITSQSARITGSVAPGGLASEAYFLWRIQGGQTINRTESQQIGSGYSNVGVNETLTGLSPNTTYEYQVWGVNSSYEASGAWLSFRTLTDITNPPTSQCSDGIDNDGDGLEDANDPGCISSDDNDETNTSFFNQFKPDRDGYRFSNRGNTEPSLASKKAIFNEVFAPFYNDAYIEQWVNRNVDLFGVGGDCFGMSLSTAKEYNAYTNFVAFNQTVFNDIPVPILDEDVLQYDGDNALTDVNLKRIIANQISWAAFQKAIPVTELFTISNPAEYVLYLGDNSVKRTAHAVLPYRVVAITPGELYDVYVYDSNHPGKSDRKVTFTKIGDVWKREFVFSDGIFGIGRNVWTSISSNDTFLVRVSDFNFEVNDIYPADSLKVTGPFYILITSDDQKISGYTKGKILNNISDLLAFVSPYSTLDGEQSNIEVRGNIEQPLHLSLLPTSDETNDVTLLRTTESSYMQFRSNADSKIELDIDPDMRSIIIASTTKGYTLEVGGNFSYEGREFKISVPEHEIGLSFEYLFNWDTLEEVKATLKIHDSDDPTNSTVVELGENYFDAESPITKMQIYAISPFDNVYTFSAKFVLEAVDNQGGVGVEKTEYSIDNGTTWQTYASTSPIIITGYGYHTISYRSIDWFGNSEEVKSFGFRIVTARELLQDTKNKLKSLNNKEVEQVIKNLDLALDDKFWQDNNHLNRPGGVSVFAHLKNALNKLEEAKNEATAEEKQIIVEAQENIRMSMQIIINLAFEDWQEKLTKWSWLNPLTTWIKSRYEVMHKQIDDNERNKKNYNYYVFENTWSLFK